MEFELATAVRLSLVQQGMEVSNPYQVGKIVETNPPPDTEITESATVLVFVGVLATP